LRIIEHSRARAEFISQELRDGAVVLNGDALDRETLIEANVRAAETIIAVTNDDETNIFSSVLAKREGCSRAITLVNKASYEPLLPILGIDAVVTPNAITISSILRHVRHRSVSALYSLREDFGEVIEATAQKGSRLVSGSLGEVGLPAGMLIGAVVRDEEVIMPTSATVIQPGDRVIALVTYRDLRRGEALLVGPAQDEP
jgi:trk system potassium uptake protein TrkA